MSRYLPPAKRAQKLASEPIISLSPDNFPEFVNSPKSVSPRVVSPPRSSKSFSDCFKVVEPQDDERKSYPGGISPAVRAKMIQDGWEFLSLSATKMPGFCERWNTKMAFVPPEDTSWFSNAFLNAPMSATSPYTRHIEDDDDQSYMSESSSSFAEESVEMDD